MGTQADIRVPLPEQCQSEFDRQRHLGKISERLTANLHNKLGDGFRVVHGGRPVTFGGQWSRDTLVYRHGRLRATFSVAYDSMISPDDFQVSCVLTSPATALPELPVVAASLVLAAGATALGGPLAGVIAGATTLLAATLARSAWPFGRSTASEEHRDELLDSFDREAGVLRLDPLLS